MQKVHVSFDVLIPKEGMTDAQIEEWLRFQLHDNGTMSGKNPLVDETVEPIFGTFDWDCE